MHNRRAATPHVENARSLLKRATRGDIQPGNLLADEKIAFGVEGVHGGNPLWMRLLAWRRAGLFLAVLLSAVPTLLNLVTTLVEAGKDETPGAIAALSVLSVMAGLVAFLGLFLALRRWDRWQSSRRILFWTWAVGFVAPFLVALFPFRSLAAGLQNEALVGMLGALAAVIDLGPKALSLLPGLVRAAIVVKVLLPEHGAPGWLIQLAAPLYMLLVFVILLVPYQLAGGGLMAPALFALIAAPIFVWRAGRRMSAPQQDIAALHALVRQTRLTSLSLNAIGGLLAFIGLVDVLGELKLNWFDALVAVLALVANVFVLSVLAVDLILGAILRQHALTPEDRRDPALGALAKAASGRPVEGPDEATTRDTEVHSPSRPRDTDTTSPDPVRDPP